MAYDIEKTVPKRTVKSIRIPRLKYKFRLELCQKMKEIDDDINFYSLRPLTHEFLNFIDGKRTISEIAEAVGYEYGVKIKGEHVLLFMQSLKEEGYISLESSK